MCTPPSFVVTTDSRHNLPIYPNLARQTTPTAINQLWIADITYIRLRTEFVYLAVVLDAFSRRVIGWALGRTLESELALAALRMALLKRRPASGLYCTPRSEWCTTGLTAFVAWIEARYALFFKSLFPTGNRWCRGIQRYHHLAVSLPVR